MSGHYIGITPDESAKAHAELQELHYNVRDFFEAGFTPEDTFPYSDGRYAGLKCRVCGAHWLSPATFASGHAESCPMPALIALLHREGLMS